MAKANQRSPRVYTSLKRAIRKMPLDRELATLVLAGVDRLTADEADVALATLKSAQRDLPYVVAKLRAQGLFDEFNSAKDVPAADVRSDTRRAGERSAGLTLVTGSAGFVGSNFVLGWIDAIGEPIVSVDSLTYGSNMSNLDRVHDDSRHVFIRGDIGNTELIAQLLRAHRPRSIVNFACDVPIGRRVLERPTFVEANVGSTLALLEAARVYWNGLQDNDKAEFRFLHVSSDEVFGSLDPASPPFPETAAYAPSSLYGASKAAADHLVHAYYRTYGLPTLITICSNAYGPHQFPDKLIPLLIRNALIGQPLPVYGDGQSSRAWVYVNDLCCGIRAVLNGGRVGESYNICATEKTVLEVVKNVCDVLDDLKPKSDGASYRALIAFAKARPGHYYRYALDASKIKRELGWKCSESFETGLRKTVEWYLDNLAWVDDVISGRYQQLNKWSFDAGAAS